MTLFATYDFPLRPLRVPEGWRVNYNDFCEVPFDHPEAWRYAFKESLLMLAHERRGVLVDLGWYPDQDETGGYLLRVFEGDHAGVERHAFETRDPAVVTAELERLLDALNRGKFPAVRADHPDRQAT